MFNSRKKQKLIEMVGMLKPTSKATLKQQCLMLCNLDVDKAERMYDFLVKDINDIPTVEQDQKSFMQSIGDSANSILAWLRDNQDILSQGVDLLKSFTKNGSVTPTQVLPQINP